MRVLASTLRSDLCPEAARNGSPWQLGNCARAVAAAQLEVVNMAGGRLLDMYSQFILRLWGRAHLRRIRSKQKRRLNTWHLAFRVITWRSVLTAGYCNLVFFFFFVYGDKVCAATCLSGVPCADVSMLYGLCSYLQIRYEHNASQTTSKFSHILIWRYF